MPRSKRPADGDAGAPPARRDMYRAEMRSVYECMTALEEGLSPTGVEGRLRAADTATAADLEPRFSTVLQIASTGSCGAKRAAAHLIATYASAFPARLPDALKAQFALCREAVHKPNEHPYPCQVRLTVLAALKGISAICAAASAVEIDPEAVASGLPVAAARRIVTDAVRFLLTRIASTDAPASKSSGRRHADAPLPALAGPDEARASLMSALQRALWLCPGGVLQEVLSAARGSSSYPWEAQRAANAALARLVDEAEEGEVGESAAEVAQHAPQGARVLPEAFRGRKREATWARREIEHWMASVTEQDVPGVQLWGAKLRDQLPVPEDDEEAGVPMLPVALASSTLLVSAGPGLDGDRLAELVEGLCAGEQGDAGRQPRSAPRQSVLHVQTLPPVRPGRCDATVTLRSVRTAAQVVERLSRATLGGKRVTVEFLAHDPEGLDVAPTDASGSWVYVGRADDQTLPIVLGKVREILKAGEEGAEATRAEFDSVQLSYPTSAVLLDLTTKARAHRVASGLLAALATLYPDAPATLRVSGLTPDVSRADVLRAVESCGLPLVKSALPEHCGWGFLRYATAAAAAQARAVLHGGCLGGDALLRLDFWWNERPRPVVAADTATNAAQAAAPIAARQSAGGSSAPQSTPSAPVPTVTQGRGLSYQGALTKEGLHVCQLFCRDFPTPAVAQASDFEAKEPAWPEKLLMSAYVKLQYLLDNVLASKRARVRAVRRLTSSPARNERRAFIELLNDFATKGRAGVVEIKADASKGLPKRIMYLVPPSRTVATKLAVEWDPHEILYAIVMPTNDDLKDMR
ncbi:unnamed protein product [Pedinophyceae sp. YPF-701]|nr:unnamed protein product [Pedinophyceae sp. YPF-701]